MCLINCWLVYIHTYIYTYIHTCINTHFTDPICIQRQLNMEQVNVILAVITQLCHKKQRTQLQVLQDTISHLQQKYIVYPVKYEI